MLTAITALLPCAPLLNYCARRWASCCARCASSWALRCGSRCRAACWSPSPATLTAMPPSPLASCLTSAPVGALAVVNFSIGVRTWPQCLQRLSPRLLHKPRLLASRHKNQILNLNKHSFGPACPPARLPARLPVRLSARLPPAWLQRWRTAAASAVAAPISSPPCCSRATGSSPPAAVTCATAPRAGSAWRPRSGCAFGAQGLWRVAGAQRLT